MPAVSNRTPGCRSGFNDPSGLGPHDWDARRAGRARSRPIRHRLCADGFHLARERSIEPGQSAFAAVDGPGRRRVVDRLHSSTIADRRQFRVLRLGDEDRRGPGAGDTFAVWFVGIADGPVFQPGCAGWQLRSQDHRNQYQSLPMVTSNQVTLDAKKPSISAPGSRTKAWRRVI